MRYLYCIFFIVISITHSTWGNEENLSLNLTSKFVQKLANGESREAIVSIYNRNNFLETRKAEIELLITNTETAFQQIGQISEFELIRVEKLTPILERHIYQLYHEKMPIHIELFTYNGTGEWVIAHFSFNTDISIIRPVANSNSELPVAAVKIAEQIMENLVKKRVEEGFREGFENSGEQLKSDAMIDNIKRQLDFLITFLGDPIGYSKASHEAISPRHVKMVYYLNLENHPIVFVFDFYQNFDGVWSIINFNINDQFDNIEANIP